MTEVTLGSIVKYNDPREPNRVMVIHAFEFDKVLLRYE